jgi:sugar phosphate permease
MEEGGEATAFVTEVAALSMSSPKEEVVTVHSPLEPLKITPPRTILSRLYSIYVLVILCLVYLSAQLDRSLFSVMYPRIKKQVHLEDKQLGIIMGPAFSFSFFTAGIIVAFVGE